MSGPLEDITVVEIANWIAAPSATALMVDMGASVIKVEPPSGDSMRNKLRQPRFAEGFPGTDVVFQLDNRGKRSIAVDIGDERGQAIVGELTDKADVVVTNLTRSRLERFGLGPDQVRARNPGLVYALVTGQGSTGEDADQLAFDVTAFFGRGGVTALLGEPDGLPVAPRAGQGDHPTGLALLVAILGALRVRDRTGEGQVVETALMRVGAWTIGCDLAASSPTGGAWCTRSARSTRATSVVTACGWSCRPTTRVSGRASARRWVGRSSPPTRGSTPRSTGSPTPKSWSGSSTSTSDPSRSSTGYRGFARPQ
jgi:crotonobetainyl-CoA:carnitine CoA-transferase CaiB-like acyl-CoA transferase